MKLNLIVLVLISQLNRMLGIYTVELKPSYTEVLPFYLYNICLLIITICAKISNIYSILVILFVYLLV